MLTAFLSKVYFSWLLLTVWSCINCLGSLGSLGLALETRTPSPTIHAPASLERAPVSFNPLLSFAQAVVVDKSWEDWPGTT